MNHATTLKFTLLFVVNAYDRLPILYLSI